MGHVNGMGQSYSELSPAKLELEYLRVEPYLTVYGEVDENAKTKEEVQNLRQTIGTLSQEISKIKELL